MTYLEILRAQLPGDEGRRNMPYTDTAGKLTIGVGRNLSDHGVNDQEIEMMLENDIAAAEMTARAIFKSFDALSDVRRSVIVNMAFNLGYRRLLHFVNFIAAVEAGQWETAAGEMLNSLWAQEVGQRAIRLANMMRSDAA